MAKQSTRRALCGDEIERTAAWLWFLCKILESVECEETRKAFRRRKSDAEFIRECEAKPFMRMLQCYLRRERGVELIEQRSAGLKSNRPKGYKSAVMLYERALLRAKADGQPSTTTIELSDEERAWTYGRSEN